MPVSDMQEALERGEVLAVFPEGTTSDGREMLPFHANLLQAAVAAKAPVQPVGLRFADKATGATSFAPSYIGDETLVGSIWRTLRAPAIAATNIYMHGASGWRMVMHHASVVPDDSDFGALSPRVVH